MIILDAVKSYNNLRCCQANTDISDAMRHLMITGCCEVLMIFCVAVRHFRIIWDPVRLLY